MLFTKTINGVESWVDIYQSTEAFEPLVKGIFHRHHMHYHGIKNLTPGSNAVFLDGDLVIKIFYPVEAGLGSGDAFSAERAALKHVNGKICSPKLLHSGTIEDKYSFQYIIMEYIRGQEFIEKRSAYTQKQKRKFATAVKMLTNAINIPLEDAFIPVVTKKDCIENRRWDYFQKSFCADRISVIEAMSFDNPVYVHGDLKAANIIITEREELYLIDYADSHIAPAAYEWPFIVFGLFGCDRDMMQAYFGDYHNDAFYTELTNHLLMHKFGAFILLQICELTDTSIDSIVNVNSLWELVKNWILSGDMLIE